MRTALRHPPERAPFGEGVHQRNDSLFRPLESVGPKQPPNMQKLPIFIPYNFSAAGA
jgi:hypothetical protein